MANIPTGFKIKPLVGSLESEQLLIRYLPVNRFIDMLTNGGIWFTRIYKWKNNDACEASLLPNYIRYLRKDLRDESEYLHAKSLMEFQLRANFGCCFSLYDGEENDLMWRSYTREPDFGVAMVISAGDLVEALNSAYPSPPGPYLTKVRYLSDQQANTLALAECVHSKTKHGKYSWDVVESNFFKRNAFQSEREVRAILSSEESWIDLLNEFLVRENIAWVPAFLQTPSDQPYLRLDKRNSLTARHISDQAVFLTISQMRKFTTMVVEDATSFFDRNAMGVKSSGKYVNFSMNKIKKIIFHPRFSKDADVGKQSCLDVIHKMKIECELEDSSLYQQGWPHS